MSNLTKKRTSKSYEEKLANLPTNSRENNQAAINNFKKFVKENQDTSLQLIEFCIYDDKTYNYFQKEFDFVLMED